jgi:Immunoglobulin domain
MAIFGLSGTTGPVPPIISTQPASTNQFVGSNVLFSASAVANVSITYQWQKGTNNVFINLSDGGNISGSTTAALTINNVGFADQSTYRLVTTDTAGSATTTTATLGVFSTLTDVTQPGDPITSLAAPSLVIVP